MAELTSFIDVEIRSPDSSSANKIVTDLKKIESANDAVQKETKQTGDAFKKSGDDVAKSTEKATKGTQKFAKEAKMASSSTTELQGGVKGLAKEMGVLSKLSLAGIIAGVGLAVGSSLSIFKDFEQSIANLSAITGATGEDLKFYSDAAREMGAVTTLSASEVAEAFKLVASAKPDLLENAEALKEVTASAITLAEAAGISVPEAANTMASALNQFGEEADQAARFTDVLAAGSKFGAASIGEMGEALRESGTAASSLGLNFEDTNAALQLLSTNAIKGSSAGTQLRGVLLGLETKTDDFRPSVLGVSEALRRYGEAGFDTGEQLKVFGRLNLTAGQILTENADKFDDLREKMEIQGIATEQAGIRTNTLDGSMKRLGSSLEELALVLTDDGGVGGGLRLLVDGMIALVDVIAFSLGGLVDLTKFLWDVSGAAEFLSETFGGTGSAAEDMFGSLEEVRALIANGLITAISYLGQFFEIAFDSMLRPIKILQNTFIDLIATVVELAKKAAPVFDKIFGTDSAKSIIKVSDNLKGLKTEVKSVSQIVQDASKKYGDFRKEMNETTKAQIEQIGETKKLKEITEKTTNAKEDLGNTEEELGEAVASVVEELQEELDALGRTDEEQEIYIRLKEAGVEANSEAGQGIIDLVGKIYEEKDALDAVKDAQKEAEKAAKDLEKANVKSAQETAKAAKKAAEETEKAWLANRDALADVFVDFAENGKSAFSNVFDNFKTMLFRMIAEAAANQILLSIGAVAGVTGTGSLTSLIPGLGGAPGGVGGAGAGGPIGAASSLSTLSSGASTVGGLFSGGVSSIGTNFLNSYSGFYQDLGNFFSDAGLTSVGDTFTDKGIDLISGTTTEGFTQIGLDIGAGIIGSFAGNKVFGDTTGVGSTVGGIVGSAYGGPIGAGVGSFLGTGVEKVFGDAFGFGGKGGNNAGRSTFDFGSGEIVTAGIGNNFDQENVDIAGELAEGLKTFSDTIGGSNFSSTVKVGNTSGIKLDGQRFDDVESFFDEGFDRILDAAQNLDPELKELIRNFEGTAEETLRFAETLIVNKGSLEEASEAAAVLPSYLRDLINEFQGTAEQTAAFTAGIVSLNSAIQTNPVEEAFKDVLTSLAESSNSVLTSYTNQIFAIQDLITNFDGSALATTELSQAFALNKQAAYDLSVGIINLSLELSKVFENSANSIRESLLSEEELTEKRLNERDTLRASLESIIDPQLINETAREIDRLNNLLFQGLSAEEQQAQGEAFALFAEETGEIAHQQLVRTLSEISATQEELNTQISELLQSAAQKQQVAADTMVQASQNMDQTSAEFARWVQFLTSNGIPVTVNLNSPEVNV